ADGHRLFERQRVQPGHAHQAREAVDLRRAGAALAGLAVPAHGEVVGLLGLDAVDGVEDDHALRDFGRVVAEGAALAVAAPDGEGRLHDFISSMICFSSAGISGIGRRSTRIEPPAPFRMTTLTLPNAGSCLGRSSRKCAPRLSLRSIAERVMASETASKWLRSSAVCQPGL